MPRTLDRRLALDLLLEGRPATRRRPVASQSSVHSSSVSNIVPYLGLTPNRHRLAAWTHFTQYPSPDEVALEPADGGSPVGKRCASGHDGRIRSDRGVGPARRMCDDKKTETQLRGAQTPLATPPTATSPDGVFPTTIRPATSTRARFQDITYPHSHAPSSHLRLPAASVTLEGRSVIIPSEHGRRRQTRSIGPPFAGDGTAPSPETFSSEEAARPRCRVRVAAA